VVRMHSQEGSILRFCSKTQRYQFALCGVKPVGVNGLLCLVYVPT
jgi:hypothetical protein